MGSHREVISFLGEAFPCSQCSGSLSFISALPFNPCPQLVGRAVVVWRGPCGCVASSRGHQRLPECPESCSCPLSATKWLWILAAQSPFFPCFQCGVKFVLLVVFLQVGKMDVKSCFGRSGSLPSTSETVHSGCGLWQLPNPEFCCSLPLFLCAVSFTER